MKVFNTELGILYWRFIKCHRDLGVEVDRDLKFHCHVTKLVHRAAGLSNSLLRATLNRSPRFLTTLFVTHIRPILDYCSTVWNVCYAGDVSLFEGVQRRWTKNIDGMNGLSYMERLQFLKLFLIKGRLYVLN